METIKLDLIPGKKMPSLHASQYDDGRDYHIDLTENRVPYVLDGTETISLTVRKCDNTLVTMDIANTFADKSYIEFRTTEQCNACSGFNYGEITIEKNGTQISSLNFYLQVEGAPDEGGITSQSEINNLKRQVHDAVVEELEDNGAEDTGYDNTESGLEATNVQDAIDEVNTKIENIPSVDAYTKEETDDKFATKTALEEVANAVEDKADATATSEALAKKANSSVVDPFIVQSTVYFDEATTGGGTDYYLKINKPVVAGNYYLLKIKATTAGTYTLRAGTSASISSMVDIIGEIKLEANVEKDVFWYVPTGDYLYFGIGANVDWSFKVYAIFDNTIVKESVKEADDIDVSLGEELMNESGVYSVGFSGDLENGYTYDGTTDNGRLRFTLNISKDKIYLLEFDCSYSAGECLGVACSGYDYIDPIALCYNGTNHIVIPIKSYGIGLFLNFFVQNKVSFTLTNITFKEITLIGYGSKTLTLDSVMSKSNNKNLGFWNVFLGVATADDTVSGTRTIAIGNYALGSLKTGNRNIGIGTFAMSQLVRGENNISIGADTMLSVDEGYDNIAIGKSAMYDGQNVANNIAIGDYALSGSGTSTQQYNVAIGQNSAIHGVGNGNTMVGHQAGYRFSTNNYNVMVGFNTLGRSSGDYNVCIGCLASFASGINNSIAIGKSVETTKSNQMKLGNAEITEVVFCGNKKINFNQDGTVTWETLT